MNLAPVLLFAYKRLDCLKATVDALKLNQHAPDTDVIIFSDGFKGDSDREKVLAVRRYLHSIKGFRNIIIHEAECNRGLANSIKAGVSRVFEEYDRVIVLEDDLVTASNFLAFMNEALEMYSDNEKVFSVTGYSFPISRPENYKHDNYFHERGCSWGWGTWKNRWNRIDWNQLNDIKENDIHKTRTLGSDFPTLIKKYKESRIDSWAVPWCYHSFLLDLVTVYPTASKIRNIGFDGDATHTGNASTRFDTQLDNSHLLQFNFQENIRLNPYYREQYLKKFSVYERLRWRLRRHLVELLG